MGYARGFGGSVGTATSNILTSAVVSNPSGGLYSISCWVYRNGAGGSSFGNLISKLMGANTTRVQWDNASTRWTWNPAFSGTAGNFSWTGGGSTTAGKWQHLGLTYNGSDVANSPSVLVDGVPVTVTVVTAPVGTISTSTSPYCIGNRAAVDRVFDGIAGPIAIWHDILLPGNVMRQLGLGTSADRFAPSKMALYFNPDVAIADMVGKRALTISGGRAQFGPRLRRAPATWSFVFPQPQVSTFSGSGAISLVVALAGAGSEKFTGSGSAAVRTPLVGAGSEKFSGSGSSPIVVALAGIGSEKFSGSGSTPVRVALVGAGSEKFSGSGSAPVALALAGVGSERFSGSGSVSYAPALTGVGSERFSGSGSVPIAMALAGLGSERFSGSGSVPVRVVATGAASLKFSGSGTLPFGLTLTSSGAERFSGTGSVAVRYSLVGAGTAPSAGPSGSGSLFIGVTVAGVGKVTWPTCLITVVPMSDATITVEPMTDSTVTVAPMSDATITVT